MLETVDVGSRSLDAYRSLAAEHLLDALAVEGDRLRGARVLHVNATPYGGGVSELLRSVVPLQRSLGLVADWRIIRGDERFFQVTKAVHNGLQGASLELTDEQKATYIENTKENANAFTEQYDFVFVHDPQPAAILTMSGRGPGRWIWRCHIDLSKPHEGVWDFLRPMVEQFDAAVVSAPAFTRQLAIPQYLFFPSIDPLSEKNRPLEESFINKVCDDFGIDRSRPILCQISRFDRLKDPVGVIEAYKLVKKYVDCQLVLAGGGATDDPEGAVVLQEVMDAAGDDPDVIILNLPPWSALEINALQRASTIIIQKSLKEGFGLTVTEGLWKEKPVVAGAVGGIPSQIVHKLTGVLVHSVEGCAYQIRYLLTHPEFAAQLGKNGREHAKENFLITVNLKRWLLLFQILLGMAKPSRTI